MIREYHQYSIVSIYICMWFHNQTRDLNFVVLLEVLYVESLGSRYLHTDIPISNYLG